MRLPILIRDSWELVLPNPTDISTEVASARQALRRGDAVKLIFRIAPGDATIRNIRQALQRDDSITPFGHPAGAQDFVEAMWVTLTEKVGDFYIGTLFNQPGSKQPGDPFYLCAGAEVPFLPEYVIDIQTPPPDVDVEERLAQNPPTRTWNRDEPPMTNQEELARMLDTHATGQLTSRNKLFPTGLVLLRTGQIVVVGIEDRDPQTCLDYVNKAINAFAHRLLAFAVCFLVPTRQPEAEPPTIALVINTGGLGDEIRHFVRFCYQEPGRYRFSDFVETQPAP